MEEYIDMDLDGDEAKENELKEMKELKSRELMSLVKA